MADVSLTSGMRANLLQLRMTESLLDRTQQRIATGKKVNSALDGPAAFFAAKALSDRASDLSALKDSMGQAVSTVKAADVAITKITDLVKQARALAQSAQQNLGADAASTTSRATGAAQYDILLTQIDEMVADAGYAGKNLLIGDGSIVTANDAQTTSFDGTTGLSGSSVSQGVTADTYSAEITEGPYGRIAKTDFAANQATAAAGSGTMTNLSVTGSLADATASSSVNIAVADGTGNGAEFTISYDGAVSVLQATEGGADQEFTTTLNGVTVSFTFTDDAGAAATVAAFNLVDATSADHGDDFRLILSSANDTDNPTITMSTYADDSAATAGYDVLAGAGETTAIAASFATGTVQATWTFDDAVVDGPNDMITLATAAADNDLLVKFNADGTSEVNISSIKSTSAGMLLSNALGSWSTAASIQSALDQIDASLTTLRDTSQTLATNLSVVQTREGFTSSFINTLEEGADKWTLADSNEEGANMLMLQTRQQLGTVSLSIASQSAQSILRLFG